MQNGQRRRLVQGAEEEKLFQKAQVMAAQGKAAFGPAVENSFSVEEDMKQLALNIPQAAEIMKEDLVKQQQAKQEVEAVAATEAPVVEEAEQTTEQASEILPDDPEARLEMVAKQLAEFSDKAPSKAQLADWKAKHGGVFILPIDDRVFIYRFLKRQEWVQMTATGEVDRLTPDQLEERLFDRCVLWPDFSLTKPLLPAGTIPMVVEQIRLHSYFLDPQAVAMSTIKL